MWQHINKVETFTPFVLFFVFRWARRTKSHMENPSIHFLREERLATNKKLAQSNVQLMHTYTPDSFYPKKVNTSTHIWHRTTFFDISKLCDYESNDSTLGVKMTTRPKFEPPKDITSSHSTLFTHLHHIPTL